MKPWPVIQMNEGSQMVWPRSTQLTEGRRKSDCPPDIVQRVQRIEDRSDKCYRELALLRLPWNAGAWAALTDSITVVEGSVPSRLRGSRHHLNIATNASFVAAQIYNFARQFGGDETLDWSSLAWSRRLALQCKHAFEVCAAYSTFCTVFPYWHANRYAGELVDDNTVRFVSNASSVGRRINAYQQGIRPKAFNDSRENEMETTPALHWLFARSLSTAQRTSKYGVRFSELEGLWETLYAAQEKRTMAMSRRYPDIRIGDYSLDDFRKFYSAINAIAAAHEHLCYLWSSENGLPVDSLLLFDHRFHWGRHLARLTHLSHEQIYGMIKDATFGRVYSVNFHLLPFVPLKRDKSVLALAPYCSLSSNWEENILSCFSRIDSDKYSLSSTSKEAEMRKPLIALTSGTRLFSGGHKLPDPLPDIDLLIEDIAANILLVGELKWSRKPSGQRERETRDKEILKGFSQIESIRKFIQAKPRYLLDQGYVTRDIAQYDTVHYCVVARDHFVEAPAGAAPLYSYDSFLMELTRSQNTSASLESLEQLEWLPQEGIDFSVMLERRIAGGATVESEFYYPAGGPLPISR